MLDPRSVRMYRFMLVRNTDVSGVSGTGVVAEGVIFSNGVCMLQWRGEINSRVSYDTPGDMMKVHGHGGATKLLLLDEVEALQIIQPGEVEPKWSALRWKRDLQYIEMNQGEIYAER